MLREYLIGEAMHALGIPTTRRSPWSPRASRCARDDAARGRARRVAASHLRVGTFQYAAATGDRDLCGGSPTTPSPATTPRPPRPTEPVPGAVPRRRRGPGRAGRPVDARRVHPRRDEHRQHDDLRRDHRLRPVRVHGRLRPGHGVQLHRPRRPLRLRQPAPARAVEPGPARRDAAAADRRRHRRGGRGRHGRRSRGFPDATRGTGTRAWPPSSGSRAPDPELVDRPAGAAAAPSASTTRRSSGRSSAGHRARRCSPSPSRSTPGRRAATRCCPPTGPRWRAAMDRVNPVYIPRNHLVEEALDRGDRRRPRAVRPAARRRAPPFEERPGLEEYAGPAPSAAPRTSPTAAPERGAAGRGPGGSQVTATTRRPGTGTCPRSPSCARRGCA